MEIMKMSVPHVIPMKKNWALILLTLVLFSAFSLYLYAGTKESREVSLQAAMSLAKEGKNDEAIAAIKRVMQEYTDSDNVDAYLRLGHIFFRTHQFENAIDSFDKAIAAKADNPMAYYFSGMIYEKIAITKTDKNESTGLKRKALEAWENYLKYAREDEKRPESHKNICISVKESIKRAKKHVALLNEELLNENQ